MNIPIKTTDNIPTPVSGFGYLFIDYESKELKCKKDTGEIIKFNTGNNIEDITLLDLCDYTAFEVFAHDYVIPSGEICEELGGYVTNEIPVGMEHQMYIRTTLDDPTKSDIIIDWGDDSFDKFSDNIFTISSSSPGDVTCLVKHEYKVPGKYIVKIFGKDYYNIYTVSEGTSLICRILDNDLPIASHIINMSSFARYSNRLLKVKLPEYYNTSHWNNVASLFQKCTNLLSLTGFSRKFGAIQSLQYFLAHTTSLQECDLTIPPILFRDGKELYNFAYNCGYVDLDQLFSNGALDGSKHISMAQAFRYAKFKEGTIVPADKLWNDKTKIWEDIKATFAGCDSSIRSQVPVSWGGTASDDIIEKPDSEKILELELTVTSLMERISALENPTTE